MKIMINPTFIETSETEVKPKSPLVKFPNKRRKVQGWFWSDSFHLLSVDKNLNSFFHWRTDGFLNFQERTVSSTFSNIFKLNAFL